MDEFFLDSFEYDEVWASPIAYVAKHEVKKYFPPLKLQTAFKSFKKGKSPGLDGMRAEVLQNLTGQAWGGYPYCTM